MWKPPELSVSGGFFLIVGWFAVSCGGEAALLVLSAALLHELGHILALRLSGAGICWLRISVLGAIMETRGNLSYGQELLCLLAGPGANLLAAVLFGAAGVLAARRPPPFAALRYGSCGRRAGAYGCCLRRWDCWRRQSAVSGRGEHFSDPVTFA